MLYPSTSPILDYQSLTLTFNTEIPDSCHKATQQKVTGRLEPKQYDKQYDRIAPPKITTTIPVFTLTCRLSKIHEAQIKVQSKDYSTRSKDRKRKQAPALLEDRNKLMKGQENSRKWLRK